MNIPGLSIPGLSTGNEELPSSTTDIPAEPSPPRTHILPAGSEYRFELPLKTTGPTSSTSFSRSASSSHTAFSIKLTSGTAEIFGTELAPNTSYRFPTGAKAAVFTWTDAALEVQGEVESEFVAEETSMVEAANVHFALDDLRPRLDSPGHGLLPAALEGGGGGGEGPRVLVLGGKDSGKSSLCKILASYATRVGQHPVVVNLDHGEGHACIPGALTATVAASLLDPESVSGWGSSGITGPSAVQTKTPLVYFYGMESLGEGNSATAGGVGGGGREAQGSRRAMWKALTTRMALAVTSRMEDDGEVKAAGCIINAPAALGDKKCYDLVEHVVSEFSINVVLVLGSERLFSDMRRKFAPQGLGQMTVTEESVRVVKLAKSEGCVSRDEAYMKALRAQQIRGYFFGEKGVSLNPLTVMVGFDDVTIYRYSEGKLITSLTRHNASFDGSSNMNTASSSTSTTNSYLPGADSDDSDSEYQSTMHSSSGTIFTKTNPSLALSNAVLAIPHIATPTSFQNDLLTSSIMGFAYVADVDETRKAIRLLVPAPTRLEGRTLVWGNWPECVVDLLG